MSADLFQEGCARADDWKRFVLANPQGALSWLAGEFGRLRVECTRQRGEVARVFVSSLLCGRRSRTREEVDAALSKRETGK